MRAVVRPWGSPLPLAFFSFGVGMLLLAGISLGWIAGPDVRSAGIFLAAFVFPLEFLCCVVAFLARDGATAATLGLFSTSWLAFGLLDIAGTPDRPSPAQGLYLIGFTVMIAALTAVTLPGKPLLGGLLVASALRSLLAGIHQLGGPKAFEIAAGVDALVIFAGAAYLGLALVLEDTRKRTVLPTGRRGPAAHAVRDGLSHQLGGLPHEAGVRAQL